MNISAVIICYNEAENIRNCLHSLQGLVDEIIVVDSGSTDGTQVLSKQYNALVYQRDFDDYATQKNWANGKASHEWILSLDADESLSLELQATLRQLKATNPIAIAFAMNRRNFLGDTAIKYGSWYPDRKVRLFRNTEARWGMRNPHEVLELGSDINIHRIKGDILHKSHNDIGAFRAKNAHYAQLTAEQFLSKGKTTTLSLAVLKSIFRFVKEFILLAGFLDGKAGWQIASSNAHYTWLKYYLVHQMKKKNVY